MRNLCRCSGSTNELILGAVYSANCEPILACLQVLSDSQKRAVYDQYGEEALKGQAPPPGAGGPTGSSYYGADGSTFRFNPRSADDIFAEFFGFSSLFSGMGGAERGMRGPRFGMLGDDMFGSFPQFPGEASMHTPQRPHKAGPVENRLPCNLADLYKGTTKKMKISREILDSSG